MDILYHSIFGSVELKEPVVMTHGEGQSVGGKERCDPNTFLNGVAALRSLDYLSAQDVDGAWAGGRGFKRQPYLTVADAGGGTITKDSISMVTATVTPSLMVRASTGNRSLDR